MAKKSNLPLFYLIGMALVIVGFCCPLFSSKLGSTNGFKFIDISFKSFKAFKDSLGFIDIGSLLIFIGAILGVVFCFVGGSNSKTFKLVALIVSLAGAAVLFIGISNDKIYSWIAKQFFKHLAYGFYILVVGWVLGLVGWITNK